MLELINNIELNQVSGGCTNRKMAYENTGQIICSYGPSGERHESSACECPEKEPTTYNRGFCESHEDKTSSGTRHYYICSHIDPNELHKVLKTN